MLADWQKMTAAELGRGIGAGRIDPRDLLRAYFQAAEASPYTARIYARLTKDRAKAEAEAAAKRAANGTRLGPLDGVPISWKDLFDTVGTETESGSPLLAGRVPSRDAEVLVQATRRGLVCLGKTHQTELAFSGLGLNPLTATPPNRYDPELLPGGSSSGAAASVAYGLAAAGIGSDTGGSVRLPAAWNGLVGLKTSHGLLPLTGTVPLCARFDTIGPLTRSVEDAALLLEAMGGGKAPDLTGVSLRGKRLMVLETLAMDGIRETPRVGFETAVEKLAAAGAQVERKSLPWLSEIAPLGGPLFSGDAWATWGQALDARPELSYPPVLSRFQSGRSVTAAEYLRAWTALEAIRARWAAETAGFDAVLLPTVPILPPKAAAVEADAELFAAENLLSLRNTRIGNVLGLCALTLPTEAEACGLMLMAPPRREAKLLCLGAAAEKVLT